MKLLMSNTLLKILPLIAAGILLSACASHEIVISSDEVASVAKATQIKTSTTDQSVTYIGPEIFTVGADNTSLQFWLVATKNSHGHVTYRAVGKLVYLNGMREYQSAQIVNGATVPFKSINRMAGPCGSMGCEFGEEVSIELSEDFLVQKKKTGFEINVSSKKGVTNTLFYSISYLTGYMSVLGK